VGDQDLAIADALSMQIADDRRSQVQTDTPKAGRLREQRLAAEVAAQRPDVATQDAQGGETIRQRETSVQDREDRR
jgi:hypothetical protein